jgi:hypothetical protein
MSSEAKKIIELIKSRGYWEIDIRPTEPKENRFESIADCMKKVRESVVELRGWPYPLYFDSNNPYPMQERIEGTIDSGAYREYWTMFLSGHFYHLFACREDWLKEEVSVFGPSRYSNTPPGTVLDFLSTLYSVTEIFEFATRLAQKKVFGRGVNIRISLHGMEGRQIISFDIRRWIGRPVFVCREKNISFEKKISVEGLVAQGHQTALDTVVGIFEMFNWLNVQKEVLKEDQKKFLEKRI